MFQCQTASGALPHNLEPGRCIGQVSGTANFDSAYPPTDASRKRTGNGSADPIEPAVKREKVDSSYDAAFSQELATLLGTVEQSPRSLGVTHTFTAPSVSEHQPVNHTQSGGSGAHRRKATTAIGAATNGRKKTRRELPRLAPRVNFPSTSNSSLGATSLSTQLVSMANAVQGASSSAAGLPTSMVVYISQPGSRPPLVQASRMSTANTSSTILRPIIRLPSGTSSANDTAQNCSTFVKSVLENPVVPRAVEAEPPPRELHLPGRPKHACTGCGSMFNTVAGLSEHMNRRTMVLSFRCVCSGLAAPELFYNPCAYNAFYLSHCQRPGAHIPRDAVSVSVLELDTPEYRSCMAEQRRQRKETTEKETNQNSDKQRHPTAAGSSCNGQTVAASREGSGSGNSMPTDVCRSPANGSKGSAADIGTLQKNSGKKSPPSSNHRSRTTHGKRQTPLSANSSEDPRVSNFFTAMNHNRSVCLECSAVYATRGWLATHFLSNCAKTPLYCSICRLTLPNSCSGSAHTRLHSNQRPFVCPVCGLVFDEAESEEVFRAHVEKRCVHVVQSSSDFALSSCPQCSFELSEPDAKQMVQHFLDEHLTTYHKCDRCPKAFANAGAADRHGETTGHDARKYAVWKCPLCDTVYRDWTDTETHITEHLAAPVLQCPVCRIPGNSRKSLIEHVRSTHPKDLLPATTCEVCGRRESTRAGLFEHVSTQHPQYFESVMKSFPIDCSAQHGLFDLEGRSLSDIATNSAEPNVTSAEVSKTSTNLTSDMSTATTFECSRCQTTFQSNDTYKRHRAKHRFLEMKKASRKQASVTAVPASNGDPLLQVPAPKEHVCTRCCENFTSTELLDSHTATAHTRATWHWCQLCAAGFSSDQSLERHVETRHHGKDHHSSHAFTCALCTSEDVDPVRFCAQAVLTKHLQSVHKLSRAAAAQTSRAAVPISPPTADSRPEDVAQESTGSSEDAESARSLFVLDKTTAYQCSRCEFSVDDRSVFVVHAAEHRASVAAPTVQCMECAAAFTASTSLGWHLRLVHNIPGNVDSYLAENGVVRPARPQTPETLEMNVDDVSPAESRSSFSTPTAEIGSGWRQPASGGSSPGKSRTLVGRAIAPADDDDGPAECTVCYQVFLTTPLLRSHMRRHGMAFIQRTRRRLTPA